MLNNLKTGVSFVCIGITLFVFFSPTHMSGKIAVAILSVILIAAGILYLWVYSQENKK